jgi:hypothetical protein
MRDTPTVSKNTNLEEQLVKTRLPELDSSFILPKKDLQE